MVLIVILCIYNKLYAAAHTHTHTRPSSASVSILFFFLLSLLLLGRWHRSRASVAPFLDGQKQLELRGELFLGVQTVRKVDAADPAVGVDLHAKSLDVIGTIGAAREV